MSKQTQILEISLDNLILDVVDEQRMEKKGDKTAEKGETRAKNFIYIKKSKRI